MSWTRGLVYRVLSRLRPARAEKAFMREVAFHLAMETRKYEEEGMSADDARERAEQQFGNVVRLGDGLRDVRGGEGILRTLALDLRFALRSLRRSPGFAAVVVLTFAVGVGANSAVFTAVDAVVLRSLPMPHAERLVHILPLNPREPGVTVMSFPDFRDYSAAKSIERAGVYVRRNVTIAGAGDPMRAGAAAVTSGFFDALAVSPAIGRRIIEDDTHANSPLVVVLSHGLWVDRFSSDSRIVGRLIQLGGRLHEVVGVMPGEFDFPEGARLWTPFRPTSYDLSENGRGNHDYTMIARLAQTATLAAADRDIHSIAARLSREFPRTNADYSARVESLKDFVVGDVRTPLLVLLGAVTSILLIACANVANLILARTTARSDEYAVRAALGAGPGRLVMLLFAEAFALTAIGGALGLFAAWGGARMLLATQPRDIPRIGAMGVDGRVLLFTLLSIVLCTLLVSLLPAVRASRASMYAVLREGRRGGRRRQGTVRNTLVIVETALAALLMVGASLFLQSFVNLRHVDTGFSPPRALSFGLTLPGATYDDVRVRTFYRELFARIKALPGVEAAGAVSMLPLGRSQMLLPFHVADAPPAPDSLALVSVVVATPGYFEAMGVDVVLGRPFDGRETSPAVVLSEAVVRQAFRAQTPLGAHVALGWNWNGKVAVGGPVVGVVRDVRASIKTDARPTVYVLHTNAPLGAMNVVVRVDQTPQRYVAAIRSLLSTMDPTVAMADIRTVDELVAEATAEPRFYTTLISVFAGIAVLLASLGLFGVISYTVALRRREIGIRMALGARATDVAAVVLGQGALLAAIGIAIGITGALGLSRVLEGVLFKVSTTDPVAYFAAIAILGSAAMIGAVLPAVRAARVDPAVTLRAD